MDERRMEMIKAAAKYADVQVADYDELSKIVDMLAAVSERHLKVYNIPGAMACVGHAAFLSYAFGANGNRAFMEDKFARKEGHVFYHVLQFLPDLESANERGLTNMERLAVDMMAAIANSDGDIQAALEAVVYDLAERMDYSDVIIRVGDVVRTILEKTARVVGKQVVRDMHKKFNDAYLAFLYDVRNEPDIDSLRSTLTAAISIENPISAIPAMIVTVVMTSYATGVPLEVYEKFWNSLRKDDVNVEEILGGLTEKAKKFIRNIEEGLAGEGAEDEGAAQE